MFIMSPRQRCVRSMHAPSVIGLRVWPTSLQATAAYTFGGSCCSAFQSVDRRAVRVPESFRAVAPSAVDSANSLPLVD